MVKESFTASYLFDVRTVNKSQLLGFYRFGTVGDVRSTSRRVETFGNIGYVFDSDGYLKLKNSVEGDTTYSYARTGELLEVVKPDGTIISYTNDPMGRRVAKSINGEIVEKYLWLDRTTLLAVYDGQDNLVQKFNYADSRVPYSMEKDGSVYYLAYDQVGSLRAVSDSSGNIVKEVSYDSFGNIITDSNSNFKVPFGFAGGLQDTDVGLVRFGYRDYDPNIGKWTAKDPILFNGGDSNLYGYVLNDPINLSDPLGLEPPENVPNGVNICANGCEASSMSLVEFKGAVETSGKWDYKQSNPQKYQDYGNYHFGYVTAANGNSLGFSQFGAGIYQIWSGTSSLDYIYLDNFYWGDDPHDAFWIEQGYNDYMNNYYGCSK